MFQAANGGGNDAFVAKVNPNGSALAYAGFLGGSGNDAGHSIAVDGAGNAYVTGYTDSAAATFPETTGVFQATNGGGADAFVAKVNPTGSALVYAGFLGGSGTDVGNGIAVDGAGNAYVTGYTDSAAATFPETTGVFQATNAGGTDAFVAKVGPAGSSLAFGFLGGSGTENGRGIALDGAGNAYVTGDTDSTAATFPETTGVFQATNGGGADAFVAKVTMVNGVPTISNIANRTINEDTSTGAVAFTVGDAETPAGSLTLTRTSSNTALVPVANIVFGGSGANRTVTVTPAANQSGTTTIRITVSDGSGHRLRRVRPHRRRRERRPHHLQHRQSDRQRGHRHRGGGLHRGRRGDGGREPDADQDVVQHRPGAGGQHRLRGLGGQPHRHPHPRRQPVGHDHHPHHRQRRRGHRLRRVRPHRRRGERRPHHLQHRQSDRQRGHLHRGGRLHRRRRGDRGREPDADPDVVEHRPGAGGQHRLRGLGGQPHRHPHPRRQPVGHGHRPHHRQRRRGHRLRRVRPHRHRGERRPHHLQHRQPDRQRGHPDRGGAPSPWATWRPRPGA